MCWTLLMAATSDPMRRSIARKASPPPPGAPDMRGEAGAACDGWKGRSLAILIGTIAVGVLVTVYLVSQRERASA